MKNIDYLKYLCEKSNYIPSPFMNLFNWNKFEPSIELLINVMWNINKEYFLDRHNPRIEYNIGIDNGSPCYEASYEHSYGMRTYALFVFPFQTANIKSYKICNSEKEALYKAIEFIYNNVNKNKSKGDGIK